MKSALAAIAVAVAVMAATARAQAAPTAPEASKTVHASEDAGAKLLEALPSAQTPGGARTLVQWIVLITVLSLAPAVLVMMTSFTRIVVVLGLLRQALAAQHAPPNAVITGLAFFITLAVMSPVIGDVYHQAVAPYLAGQTDQTTAVSAAEQRVRRFMIDQMDAHENTEDVYLFLNKDQAQRQDLAWRDVGTMSLIPAFVVSELKVAFLIGFKVFLPFLVIDMVVSAVLVSMGMLLLPPVLISLPFKLLLFVMVDGWHLVVGTLIRSFG